MNSFYNIYFQKANNEPFANTDAAFRLAYSIIMLNMDQHNHNAKRLNIPMTAEDFQKNLRGLNGNSDFNPEMLIEVYNAIKYVLLKNKPNANWKFSNKILFFFVFYIIELKKLLCQLNKLVSFGKIIYGKCCCVVTKPKMDGI